MQNNLMGFYIRKNEEIDRKMEEEKKALIEVISASLNIAEIKWKDASIGKSISLHTIYNSFFSS
jgi:hypothetical protein